MDYNAPTMVSKKAQEIAVATTLTILSTVFPVLFIYLRNISAVKPVELIEILRAAWPVLVFFLAMAIIMKSASRGAIVTCATVLIFLNFRTLHSGFASISTYMQYWHSCMIILTVLVLIAIFIGRMSKDSANVVASVVTGVFAFLLIWNVIAAGPKIINQLNRLRDYESKVTSSVTLEGLAGTEKDSPNVYYLIFDEYSGPMALQKYCNYDNSFFYKQLEKMGFNVSLTSHNPVIETKMIIPNLLNLKELFNETNYTPAAADQAQRNPYLFELFRGLGYETTLVNDQGYIKIEPASVDHIYSLQSEITKEETLLTTLIDNSIFYPIRERGHHYRIVEIERMLQFIGNSPNRDSGQLLISYIMFPHVPWVVDQDGNDIPVKDQANWQDPSVYLGQLLYLDQQLLSLTEKIITNDPNSIIIIQSDHAFRQPLFMEINFNQPIADKAEEYKIMSNILNIVYFKGLELDIGSLTGIETLHKVFETQYGLNFR